MSQHYKAWPSVLPFVKVTLTRSSSAPKNPSLLQWLVSLSYVLTESPWGRGRRRMKVWKNYGVICHRKGLIFWISETQTLVFFLQVGISGSPGGSSYYTVAALGCSKSIGPNTNRNCSGFCNLSGNIFSLHLDVGVVNNDVIIRWSLMVSKLSPSIKIIVWTQCDIHCLTV